LERSPQVEKLGGGASAEPNGLDGDSEIASKMQARSVDPAAETDRKTSRRGRRAKGRIEERAVGGWGSRYPGLFRAQLLGVAVWRVPLPVGRGSKLLSN